MAHRAGLDVASFERALKRSRSDSHPSHGGHEPDQATGTSNDPGFPFDKLSQVAAAHFGGRLELD